MSRFYASIQGGRGEATRQGHANGGIHGHVRGWPLGVRTDGYSGNGDRDNFAVRITGGSHGARSETFAFEVTDLGSGWLRVTTGPAFGGSVFYLDPHGNRTYRPDGAPADVRAAWLAS